MNKVRSLILVAVLAAGGCASYVPTELGDIEPQDRVRLELERGELANLLQFADATRGTVDGRYIAGTVDSISVVVRTPGAYTQVAIPRTSVLSTSLRKSDNTKSFIVSAVIVGGIAALAASGFTGRDGGPIGDGSGIDESRLPSFGFLIPFALGFGR